VLLIAQAMAVCAELCMLGRMHHEACPDFLVLSCCLCMAVCEHDWCAQLSRRCLLAAQTPTMRTTTAHRQRAWCSWAWSAWWTHLVRECWRQSTSEWAA
jgi:hypothetical protein